MKYQVRTNGKIYQVEIEDLNARPVIASVNGQRFDVMPEEQPPAAPESAAPRPPAVFAPPATSPAPNPAVSGNVVVAPLPGTVTEVFVKSGQQVETGAVLLVIEAMKMKNSIRSTYGGKVGEVLVSPGQSVAHKQALVKFAE